MLDSISKKGPPTMLQGQVTEEQPPIPFTFTVDLGVVESLGINLYSNAAAVLSELVANAWDADANEVSIDWNSSGDTITVQDDGSGMTRDEVNKRFLTVAYKRREDQGATTPKYGRPVMGRKGIGKLSIFSLANEVTVYSRKDGETSALTISLEELRKNIKNDKEYHPKETSEFPDDLPDTGTRLVLRQLNRKRTKVSVTALRRRLARRFDVLNFNMNDDDKFLIIVDGSTITYEDRQDLKRVEYMWHLGKRTIPENSTPKLRDQWVIEDVAVGGREDWKLKGWIGSVGKPEDLNDDEDSQESLRSIMVLARRRPIQEGIIDKLGVTKLFGNYVTGQIEAEFLDTDEEEDIATSDRQRLVEDDDRVLALVDKLKEIFRRAASDWEEVHPKQKFDELQESYPEVYRWVQTRPEGQRKPAEKMIRTVAALRTSHEGDRRNLFKASILAFEKIALDGDIRRLEALAEGATAQDVLPVLTTAKSYEDGLYIQILRSRLEAIETLKRLVNKNELEKTLQEHLFDNMWLLDPAWEGATGDKSMEEHLNRLRGDLFTPKEKSALYQGRIDIRYRTAAGTHMIVELKKYGRKVSLDDLLEQGELYYEALRQVLNRHSEITSKHIEVVFVLGREPSYKSHQMGNNKTVHQMITRKLQDINGRVLYYDELLTNSQRKYRDYYEKSDVAADLQKVLASLDEDGPGQKNDDSHVIDPVPEVPDLNQNGQLALDLHLDGPSDAFV
ncbi:BbrUII/HgiDII family restriction enzyme [Kocuria rosea]|uniref:BbrUII/HgiDII family restriction enzyme n=1 Tax=Kocuria rosea TaxID=1275 RepID=UPI000D61B61E|nr:ATP-binding protein [Kocuria rosea]PWD94493.1 hypothetical protein DEQ16_15770 [Dietzia maris]PWF81818.1 hypothetical protein DEJ38_08735 [Kocuria rosea]